MPRIGLRLPDLLAFSAKQLSQPPPLADRYEIMPGLRSIGVDLGLDCQILQHPLGGDAARQRFDGGFAMWHLARILRRTAGDLFFDCLLDYLGTHFSYCFSRCRLTLQLPFLKISESMGNHDSKIVDADSVD